MTNEQRAHDLTIALLPLMFNSKISELNENSTAEDRTVNFYAEYLKIYNSALEAFNRDFN